MAGHVSRRELRRWLVRGLSAYLLLLVASHAVRWWTETDSPAAVPPNVHSFQTFELVSGPDLTVEPTERLIRMTWREWSPQEAEGPVVLLVHGSPGDGSNFDRMGPALAGRGFRVVAPDLPGFGASSRDVADYSILAHAGYCLALVHHLNVADVHAVGFSMGGGVVLHLDDLASQRVASLTMLSALGVQEMELLGDYTINHAVHGAQLAGLYLLFEGFPHFGALDSPMLGIPYARNFFDTDQRPLRP